MPEKAPAFQLYAQDFISDERVALMDLRAVGAYILLLCHAWVEGSVPDDPVTAAKICRTSVGEMRRAWASVRACFQEVTGGRLVNPRQEEERAKQACFRVEMQAAAEKRWEKQRKAKALPTHMPTHIGRQCSSSSSSSSEDTPPYPPHGFDPVPGWERFMAHYPGEVIPDRDCRVYMSVVQDIVSEVLLFENLTLWRQTRKFLEGFAPSAQKFLFEGHWKVKPKPDAKAEVDYPDRTPKAANV